MKIRNPIATTATVPPTAAPATSPEEDTVLGGDATVSGEGVEGSTGSVGAVELVSEVVKEVDESCEDGEVEVVLVALVTSEDKDDDAAARLRSAYWMLHRTELFVALMLG